MIRHEDDDLLDSILPMSSSAASEPACLLERCDYMSNCQPLQRRCCALSQRQQWRQWLSRRVRSVPAPAKTAAFTGTYIGLIGLALIAAPQLCFGLLFDARCHSIAIFHRTDFKLHLPTTPLTFCFLHASVTVCDVRLTKQYSQLLLS